MVGGMKAAGAVVVVLVRRIAETVARSMPLGSRPLVRVPLVQGHALMRARPRVLLLPLLPGLPMVVLKRDRPEPPPGSAGYHPPALPASG